MKKIITYLSLLVITSLCFASPSQDLVDKIKNIKSMRANFSQKLVDSQNNSETKSKGLMILKKPDFFKWIITSPNAQQIISNSNKLWIYDSDIDQLIIKKVSNNIAQFPYLILLSKNANNIDKLFNVTEKGNKFTLKPKKDEIINSLSIQFDKNNNIESLGISTSLHQYTLISFTNIKTNISNLKDSDFDFIAPKGTDVIDETKN